MKNFVDGYLIVYARRWLVGLVVCICVALVALSYSAWIMFINVICTYTDHMRARMFSISEVLMHARGSIRYLIWTLCCHPNGFRMARVNNSAFTCFDAAILHTSNGRLFPCQRILPMQRIDRPASPCSAWGCQAGALYKHNPYMTSQTENSTPRTRDISTTPRSNVNL
jgi:hypothetical protein